MFNALYFQTFITLVETGSFTQTARKLEMTQPGVSQHVRKLETYFGLELLERKGKRFDLTEAGRQVYDYALRLFADHEQFRQGLEQDLLEGGECRMASIEVLGVLFYPFALGLLKNHHRLRLHLRFADNAEAIQDLLNRRIELALVSEMQRHPELDYMEYLSEPLIVVVPADFQGSSLHELISLGFIDHQQGQEQAGKLLKVNFPEEYRGSRQLTQRSYVNRVHLVLDAVARGLGFSVVPRSVWEASTWQQQTREWRLPEEASWTIYRVTLKGKTLPERYLHLLDEYLAWRQGALSGNP
ncbi:LysR family transcriptional regulator [Marinospirillum alkaliphilum]|uniref:Transcriptional regulator, LysR family n=1 Tax=Marinospirillum alkaliphilum DSM 21637 TaxID=1122209 RepID=A0A1K1TD20_9GAMM|nr:LysR family transcriptional regulator [Marinospirillum alkaliphilum]SFW98527.1 transcriptional regulator, LysR family [Marinospirillum alkaliphilum DSM 21637]